MFQSSNVVMAFSNALFETGIPLFPKETRPTPSQERSASQHRLSVVGEVMTSAQPLKSVCAMQKILKVACSFAGGKLKDGKWGGANPSRDPGAGYRKLGRGLEPGLRSGGL
jgi:hypothetical protein